jgi:hypothetical protein
MQFFVLQGNGEEDEEGDEALRQLQVVTGAVTDEYFYNLSGCIKNLVR